MTKTSSPVYFACFFVHLERDQEGNGLLILAYDSVTVLDMNNKQVAKCGLIRGKQSLEDKENEDDFAPEDNFKSGSRKPELALQTSKRQEIFIYENNSVIIGNKHVQIGPQVEEEDYVSGVFFTQEVKGRRLIEEMVLSSSKLPRCRIAAARRAASSAAARAACRSR